MTIITIIASVILGILASILLVLLGEFQAVKDLKRNAREG